MAQHVALAAARRDPLPERVERRVPAQARAHPACPGPVHGGLELAGLRGGPVRQHAQHRQVGKQCDVEEEAVEEDRDSANTTPSRRTAIVSSGKQVQASRVKRER